MGRVPKSFYPLLGPSAPLTLQPGHKALQLETGALQESSEKANHIFLRNSASTESGEFDGNTAHKKKKKKKS